MMGFDCPNTWTARTARRCSDMRVS
jgi:hypothetical protein